MSPGPQDELRRYEHLVRSAMGPATVFAPETEVGTAIQVERGIVLAKALTGSNGDELSGLVSPLTTVANISRSTILDRAGHTRTAYLGLLIYCWVQSFLLTSANDATTESWREPLRDWCAVLEGKTNAINFGPAGIPAILGADVSGSAWNALALFAAASCFNYPRWTALADDYFRTLAAHQQVNGAFLCARGSDNPETRGYHELVLLHSAASYAAQSGDDRVTNAVMRASDYHLNESQPDHASSQPWGLLAFIWKRDTRTFADQLLHSIRIQHPHGTDGISSMLLADCLYCLPLIG